VCSVAKSHSRGGGTLIRTAKHITRTTAVTLVLLLALRALVSIIVIRSGFRALSDDDFSRVTIAQSFVVHPSFDPSGTSWLPFPFWLYGTCLSLFGATLAKARLVAFSLGLLGALGVWLAGRWLGLSRNASLLGAIIACCVPYSAWLGVATTPDYYNAVLILLACCSLARGQFTIRALGAGAIVIATLSRYESWPVAVTWAGFVALDAYRSKNRWLGALALLALAAPVSWMLHGLQHHHDALFFVKRVVSYRRALGLVDTGVLTRVLATPVHLFRDVPELWAIALCTLLLSLLRHSKPIRRRWQRPSIALFSILLFLSIGDWRDGAATHHVGRTLLPLWFFVALLAARLFLTQLRGASSQRKTFSAVALAAIYGFSFIVLRPTWTSVDGFSPRVEQTEIGLLASAKIASGQRVIIDTPDYGYFAVKAAFARPNDTVILDAHDPRHPEKIDAFASQANLEATLVKHDSKWLIMQRAHETSLSNSAVVHYRGPTLLLAEMR
jgi:hypothetical protein